MISTVTLKQELEHAIENRVKNPDKFYTDFDKGSLDGFKEVLRRINQFLDDKEVCSLCQSVKEVMPKAGSGTVTHWVCKQCVESRGLEVLPEYLENIEEFGHWHRSLSGVIGK